MSEFDYSQLAYEIRWPWLEGPETARLRSEHRTMLENLTATQKRCTELVEEVRALKAKLREPEPASHATVDLLERLAARLRSAREKHPEGANLTALVAEVGEVADAMLAVDASPNQVRSELLDVATVAIRMWLGEVTK